MRKGFERIHGWQTSGLGSWKVPDDWWIQSLGRFVDTTSDWNIMEHMLKGIARSPCCICPKTGIRFLPSCAAAAGVPTFLLHVISRLAGRLEQWQQSCEGGPSLSKVLQCNCPLPAKWKRVSKKHRFGANSLRSNTWQLNATCFQMSGTPGVHATLGESRQLVNKSSDTHKLSTLLCFSWPRKSMTWNFQMVLAPGPLPLACTLQLEKNTFLSSRRIEQLNWMQSM